jgi:imidazole glycerol phosphate synthase glutamine amidotransferase subunit
MPSVEAKPVALAPTGVANLASVVAALRRAGAAPFAAAGPEELAAAPYALVPGVGSFGSAMGTLASSGMDEAIRDRLTRRAPTMGICAGMQVFFEASEESPGVAGLGAAPGRFGRFPSSVPVPQLGWNRVAAQDGMGAPPAPPGDAPRIVRPGWAYFANSYRILEAPAGFAASRAVYGDDFVAALESEARAEGGRGPALLLCQFHPELSGPWGLGVYKRWLGTDAETGGSR